MSAPYGGSVAWWHLDGTECLHRLCADSEAPEGVYCVVTHSDVVRDDDGGPSTGRITVVLADDEGRFVPDEPLRPVFPQTPPPSRYLDGPAERRRHRAATPGMFASWPEAMKFLGMWGAFSGVVVGGVIGLVWLLTRVIG